MPEPDCPERPRLSAYLAGKLHADAAERLRAHLEECAACRAVVATLRGTDDVATDAEPPKNPSGIPASTEAPISVTLHSAPLPPMSAADVPLGQLGEYKLIEKLGEGGMGAVYKALHTELDRIVALKIFPRRLTDDERAVARFKREMKAVARLDHPNIVRAHDAREIDGVHFLVIEYIDGLDLSDLVARIGPLPVADACELIRQAALGLDCAHRQGLVHRDVKPSNLMLGRDGRLKVLDLGLARFQTGGAEGVEMTASGQIVGTPDYMAPEQASDSRSVDPRADIYSLGCTAFKLLAGQAPFDGPAYQTAFNKMAAHVGESLPELRRFRRDVPREVVALLDRMVAKGPEGRPATVSEVADALAPFASGANLPELLAAAEGDEAPPRIAGAIDHTPAARSTTKRLPAPPSQPVWKRLVPALAAVAVLALLIPVGIVLLGEPSGDGNQTPIPEEKGPVVTKPDAVPGAVPVPVPDTAPEGWIVMSWARPRRLRIPRPDLWLLSVDGRRRIPITNDPMRFDVQPSFSPDGRRIAFIRGDSATGPNGVWVCNTDGSNARELVAAGGSSERFISPVWLSATRICYARDPRMNQLPDMEVWQADLDGAQPRRMFAFQDALGQGAGLVTDVSPDGRQLVVVAQSAGSWATSDVYVTDLQGNLVQAIWTDDPDDRKDARALWSPDGRRIAWHHNLTHGILEKRNYYGVGLARLGNDGRWTAQLQPGQETFVTPLAWSPDGRHLLCARVGQRGLRLPAARLFLMDDRFRESRELFEMEAFIWKPGQRDLGRLADWAVVPADVELPEGE